MSVTGFLWASLQSSAILAASPPSDAVLWYRQPAAKWLEALPLGNGLLGAMVFGGMHEERIALNESSFWSGRPHDYDDPDAGRYYAQLRDLVAAQRFQEAEKLADEHFYGQPTGQQAYQPLGDLRLSFDGVDAVTDYRRELNLRTGVATTRYRAGDVTLTREVFVSYPDRVMVVRISADKPGGVTVRAQLAGPYQDHVTAEPGKLVMDGTWKGPMAKDWLIAPVEGPGLRFQTALVARHAGGTAQAGADGLRLVGADSVTFLVTAATSFVNYHDIGGDAAAACERVLAACAGRDDAALRSRHEADFGGIMGRVSLDVGDASLNSKPTDERLAAVKAGGSDPNLAARCFQFGRYLLASSSRAGGQPANLQGIWNEAVIPPWGSKYTININTEMNYWPSEVCNLSECGQPLFDMIQDASETGAKTARTYYGCDGWVAHHNLDLWRGTAPVDAARFGMWPVGGAWLCQHLWEHYAFTGDTAFLRRYYPVLKGAAQFLLELLVEEPTHHWLVTPVSMSPEHGYLDAAGQPAVLTSAPTLDVALLRELFPHCIAAGRLLGVDAEFGARLEEALKRLPPYRIGRNGCLQEWLEDWQSGGQGHNCSPNFTFFPGSSIQLRRDPPLAAAIRKWQEDHPGRGGFILSWDMAVWARLERGDQVARGIATYLRNVPAANLHNGGANQSDASFGYSAAVAEALIQSHAGEISLLPALPTDWPDGSVTGLRARGGFEIDMAWQGGKLASAAIRGGRGGLCRVRYGDQTVTLDLPPGGAARLTGELVAADSAVTAPAPREGGFGFDGRVSRPVLENCLARSITMEGLLNGHGDLADNLRMLTSMGAKFVGRALCLWGDEAHLTANLARAGQQTPLIHAADPEMVLQACVFEIVTQQVEQLPVPPWAFEALGRPVETRHFRYADMIYPAGQRRDWGPHASVPDVSRPETQLWFYFLARSFIDAGCEAIHWGQVEIMNHNDRDLAHWERVLSLAREHAAKHARRHFLFCDGHVPSGGLVRDGRLLLDFHSFPLRVMELSDKPTEAALQVGFTDAIFGRSKGGLTPSGWSCEHLPYLAELDNWGASDKPGQARVGGNWVWGYDEITWFAHQTRAYRADWLRYAWDWVRRTDPNGYLQMPGSRTLRSPLDHHTWYYANEPGAAVPEGMGDEEAIRAIWAADRPR